MRKNTVLLLVYSFFAVRCRKRVSSLDEGLAWKKPEDTSAGVSSLDTDDGSGNEGQSPVAGDDVSSVETSTSVAPPVQVPSSVSVQRSNCFIKIISQNHSVMIEDIKKPAWFHKKDNDGNYQFAPVWNNFKAYPSKPPLWKAKYTGSAPPSTPFEKRHEYEIPDKYSRVNPWYSHIPNWFEIEDIEYVIAIKQTGGRSYVSSWYRNIPANRFYWTVLGVARGDEDEETYDDLTASKDCHGDNTLIAYKYIIDMWLTGDDMTEWFETENVELNIFPQVHSGKSLVNYRRGEWQLRGRLLTDMYKAKRERVGFWILDATYVHIVDYQETPWLFPKAIEKNAGYEIYSNHKNVGNQKRDAPIYSFWGTFTDVDEFDTLKTQKELIEKVRWITDINVESLCVAYNGAKIDTKNGEAIEYKYLTGINSYKKFSHAPCEVTGTTNFLTEFKYGKSKIMLPIVSCGLFDKNSFNKEPTNCRASRKENEDVTESR